MKHLVITPRNQAPQNPLAGKKWFLAGRKAPAAPAAPAIVIGKHKLVDATVSFEHNGVSMAGVVESVSNGQAVLKLAVPSLEGVLLVSESRVTVPEERLKQIDATTQSAVIKRWEHTEPFSDTKMREITEDKAIVDYQDVTIEGFASTFKETTPRDRDGDYVMPGAFDETISQFMRNPVMLTDHRNSVDNLAGSFEKMSATRMGLAVKARVSNAPELRKIRFLIAEKHLRAFSMGGLFMFGGDDGHAIVKVTLWEVSLVAVPANQDALFQVRNLTADDCAKAFKMAAQPSSKSLLTSAV